MINAKEIIKEGIRYVKFYIELFKNNDPTKENFYKGELQGLELALNAIEYQENQENKVNA